MKIFNALCDSFADAFTNIGRIVFLAFIWILDNIIPIAILIALIVLIRTIKKNKKKE